MSMLSLLVLQLALAQAALMHWSVGGGSFLSEVSWQLSCNGAELASGGGGTGSVEVLFGSACTVDMSDSYGDGWNGNTWRAVCADDAADSSSLDYNSPDYGPFSMSGSSGTETFTGGCSAPAPGAESMHFSVGGGLFLEEVSWQLSCNGAQLASGGGGTGSVTVAEDSACTLDMSDSYGDGWNGNTWVALCADDEADSSSLDYSAPEYGPFSMSGSSGAETFTGGCYAGATPPSTSPPPPSPPPGLLGEDDHKEAMMPSKECAHHTSLASMP